MGQKVLFAHYLRGISALIVVFIHYFHNFWCYQGPIDFTLNDYLDVNIPEFAQYIDSLGFGFGAFAVSIFFCISGFVMPFSVKKYSAAEFIKARFFRIWPTYIVCFFLSMGFLYLYCYYNGKIFPRSLEDMIFHITLIPEFLGHKYFDIVSWTLQIEMVFYFYCLLIYNLINKDKMFSIFLLNSLIFALAIYIFSHSENNSMRFFLSHYTPFLGLSFLGIFIYFHEVKKASWVQLLLTSSITLYLIIYIRQMRNDPIIDVCAGFGVFFISYLLHHFNIKLPVSIFSRIISSSLDYLAKISYSLYLVHPMAGLVILRLSYPNTSLGILISLLYSSIMTYIVHNYVEKSFYLKRADRKISVSRSGLY